MAWRRKKFNRKLFPWWHQSTPTVATCITCVVTLLVLLQLGLTKVVTCKLLSKLLSKSFPVFQSKMSLNWSKYSLQKHGIWKVGYNFRLPFGCGISCLQCPFWNAWCCIFSFTFCNYTVDPFWTPLLSRHFAMLSNTYTMSLHSTSLSQLITVDTTDEQPLILVPKDFPYVSSMHRKSYLIASLRIACSSSW